MRKTAEGSPERVKRSEINRERTKQPERSGVRGQHEGEERISRRPEKREGGAWGERAEEKFAGGALSVAAVSDRRGSSKGSSKGSGIKT